MAYGLGRHFRCSLRYNAAVTAIGRWKKSALQSGIDRFTSRAFRASLEMALIFFGSGDCPPGLERLPVLED
jgi:hypothetical protein